MMFYNANGRNKYFIVGILLLVFIVGCVSVQEQKTDQSFMVKTHQNSDNNTPQVFKTDISAQPQWQKGDIIYAANGYIDHMGMIDDSVHAADNSPDIIDSDSDGAIRRHNNLAKWADQGGWALIEGYYVSPKTSDGPERDMRHAQFNLGDVYNAQTEITLVPRLYKRNSPPNTHSSQLVRHTYKYLYDVDLDVDGGWWSWPKDIRQNPSVKPIAGASFSQL
jgi:hypothetical protein